MPFAGTDSYGHVMRVDDDGPSAVAPAAEGFALGTAVADMYTDLRVGTLLHRLLAHSRKLLGTVAGSISLVDTARGRYDKIAENGVSCRLGGSFPLDEGATGQAVARRMPVVIDDYSAVRGSHLPPGHPVGRGAAAAVPLWWRGEVIGVNVAFAGHRRRFTTAEVDAFELLTQSVASAVVTAGAAVPSLAGLLREHGRDRRERTGSPDPPGDRGAAPARRRPVGPEDRGPAGHLGEDRREARRRRAAQDRDREPYRRGRARPGPGLARGHSGRGASAHR